ncbi:MAG: hypothetical protein LIO75_07330 [Lachnospiraceae bacterium]|nr:hypothetical protein [Lachnospiraceae bacterium]
MYERRSRVIGIICVVICALLAGILVYMVYTNNRNRQAQSEAMTALQEEARPYEVELQNLKSELASLEDSVSYTSEEAEIMVGFVVSDVSDLSFIEEQAADYGFSPVIIIDCTMDMDVIEEILETADESWEIMLYASDFPEEVNDSILSVISCLESMNREHCGVFFLRGDYSTDSNIQLLADDGFIGYTDYNSETPKAGQAEDGSVYFDYSYVNSTGTMMSSRVSALYSSKSSILVAISMASINFGTLTEADAVNILDSLQTYTENDDCSFSTVAAVVEEYSAVNELETERQADYEKQTAEIQARIDELEEIIDEIYAGKQK